MCEDLTEIATEIRRLLRDVKHRTPGARSDYTLGYIDALVYLGEWVDENGN